MVRLRPALDTVGHGGELVRRPKALESRGGLDVDASHRVLAVERAQRGVQLVLVLDQQLGSVEEDLRCDGEELRRIGCGIRTERRLAGDDTFVGRRADLGPTSSGLVAAERRRADIILALARASRRPRNHSR